MEGTRFRPYPERSHDEEDEDSASLALLYRHRPTNAVGHGCAAEWQADEDGQVNLRPDRDAADPSGRRRSSPPTASPALTSQCRRLQRPSPAEVTAACEALASELTRTWILRQEACNLESDSVACRQPWSRRGARTSRSAGTASRVSGTGSDLLSSDRDVLDAFQTMNLAMLEQREHYELSSDSNKRRVWRAVDRARLNRSGPTRRPAYGATKWRPFQLAFVLMNLRPMSDPTLASNATSST